MVLQSFEVVFFTAGFLVPGFVWSAVLSMLMPTGPRSKDSRFVEFLTLSCINHGLWSWALFPVFKTGFLERQPWWSGAILFGIVFVSPVVLGVLTGWLQQKDAIGRFLGWLGLRTVHPIACAWDWHFGRLKPYWVVVTMKDGSRVRGLNYSRSFAGSDPGRRDLYLEADYQLLETGEWGPVEDSGGVLVTGTEIAVIEFRELGGEV